MPNANSIRRCVRRAAGLCVLAFVVAFLCAADDTTQQKPLATVKLADHIEIREVNSASGTAKVQVDVDLTGTTNAKVTQIDLRNFTVDGVVLVPLPYAESFELKTNQTVHKELVFDTPITPPMSPLVQKFGKRVKATGTAQITALIHGTLRDKNTTSSCPFSDDATLTMPGQSVRDALAKILPLPPMTDSGSGDATNSGGTTTGVFGTSPSTAGWMTDMTRRGSNNVVIIEASTTVDLAGLAKRNAKLYRHGYRYSDTEVIAPLDLQDPVKVVAKNEAGSFGDAIASHVTPGEVLYRGWTRGPHGLTASDKIMGDSASTPLKFKCKLSVGDGSHVDLGVFEFTSKPQGTVAQIDPDKASGTIGAMQLSYKGLVETQQFSSTTLAATPVTGLVAGSSYAMSPHVTAVAYGSPVFSPQGLLGIVNGDDSAVTAARISSALENGSCSGVPQSTSTSSAGVTIPTGSPTPTIPSSTPTTTQGKQFHVKMVSTPDGAVVLVDRKPAVDEAGGPVTTAGSEDACGTANTAVVSKGKHHFSFFRDGYREFAGDVDVDDDMTLTAALSKSR